MAPSDTVQVVLAGTLPDVCGSPLELACTAVGSAGTDCSASDADTTQVLCAEACVMVEATPDTVRGCAETPVEVCFDVINCSSGVEDMSFTGKFNGEAAVVVPDNFQNVGAGGHRERVHGP